MRNEIIKGMKDANKKGRQEKRELMLFYIKPELQNDVYQKKKKKNFKFYLKGKILALFGFYIQK